MNEEEINIPGKSQRIKEGVVESYLWAIKHLQNYKTSLRKHIGNQDIYWFDFCGAFEILYTLTRVLPALEECKTEDGEQLIAEIEKWLEDPTKNRGKGVKLFLAYRKALFDKGILSLTD